MISIISCGMGNISSVQNMIRKVGGSSRICTKPQELADATKIILPGVGSFDFGMNSLQENDWLNTIEDAVISKKIPILGICLGMQLMCNSSEEGTQRGLGWINATVKRFNFPGDPSIKVPHMGWNHTNTEKSNPLLSIKNEQDRFYFVHSYYVDCHNTEDILSTTHYGHDFTSAFCQNNIFGVQFHPEKSHKFGMSLIKNFVDL